MREPVGYQMYRVDAKHPGDKPYVLHYALCDDGTLWCKKVREPGGNEWKEVGDPIPGSAADEG